MTASLCALLGFAVWTLVVVVLGIGPPRISAVLSRRAPPKSFVADQPHGSERYRRTMRAHANCVENLPVFATLVILAWLIQLQHTWFEALAVLVLGARVGQSITHIASGTNRAVLLRFSFFAVQLACFAAMTGLIVHHALGQR
jgi:uncharacterized MAPEG superfamily protein